MPIILAVVTQSRYYTMLKIKTLLTLCSAFVMALSLNTFAADPVKIKIVTNQGDILLELYPDKAPITVENFIKHAESHFYRKTIFHRVIKGFMIQGGGFTNAKDRKRPPYASIKNEADNGLKNDRGTIAMARTGNPHSATAQFFINLKDNDFLNHTQKTTRGWGYTVFGKVTGGMDVVDKIAQFKTQAVGMQQNIPFDPIYIEEVIVVK